MKRSELKACPYWLREATVENENVEISDGRVIWHGGDWRGGWTTPLRAGYIPLICGDMISFGCEKKTLEEWQKISDAGTFESFTPEQFRQLKISFEMSKKYIELTNKK